ncbi:AMP-binding enzyme [Actinopolyspora xinjiangensis]|uniref:AMP-binding enzyme n=1 Tax=Actinopolyspora xinjiangensis TaxID=405564 RepID=A0A1H0WY91_9ACTN|nr:AMP-binding protein [Actinopolyspora xinjiangensis]SDP95708.1 AMP-binding enzyme [Actinopolyspora xinjiangensis]
MNYNWSDVIHGDRWNSLETLWIESGTEYSWKQVDELAQSIEEVIDGQDEIRVVLVRSPSKLGCFAGQLASWRAGCVAVADDGDLGQGELEHVRPDLIVSVDGDRPNGVERETHAAERSPRSRLPDEIVAVNFTSGSTGSRKAVGVTRGNLQALFRCRDLEVPTSGGPVSGSFATPTYDGWWFDTWKAVAAEGAVVCMPNVNEDVFDWPELSKKYGIDRMLLPAAVLATVVESLPGCISDIPWLYSGGERFRVSTYQQARRARLTNQFINLYGPAEATFATHKYELSDDITTGPVPIGRPLEECKQILADPGDRADGYHELVIGGPLLCLGYIERGSLGTRFSAGDGEASFRTGDVVQVDNDGSLVFAGRLDSQIKVNGMRVDSAALERDVAALPEVSDCRVVQNEKHTFAFVRVDQDQLADSSVRSRIESVVKQFSNAVKVELMDRFPVKPGGKIDTTALVSASLVKNKEQE